MRAIDVRHMGRDKVICCWDVDGVLVDPGPQSTEGTLLEALAERVPSALLLTHIHFDHAGASGALVRRWPDLPVYVHERGAPHMAAPERLVASAARLYGGEQELARLWGDVVPVPERNLRVLVGGETVLDRFRVEYTPGHASHHVSFLHEPSGTAFVGDVAGVRIPPSEYVMAPTPPPDIDVEAWDRSLDVVAGWAPEALALTHFGRVDDVAPHIEAMRERLHEIVGLAARHGLEAFTAGITERVARNAGDVADRYAQAAPPDHLYLGARRYLDKRAAA
ncbi:MAG TPA: MBL fold metallo-hydrolase [Solirubrobacteraceae bacterium]|nr:MBL fold metallo-hydrolase [Solirubrobacteraceae bacterium]